MAFAASAIRTAITEVIEASGPFSYGAFAGMQPDALMAKLRQTSTGEHWFDVQIRPQRTSTSSNVASGNSSYLQGIDVTITVWTGFATVAQHSARDTILDAIGSDCSDAASALALPGSLAQTDAGDATGIVGGCFSQPPTWRMVRASWTGDAPHVVHELRGRFDVRTIVGNTLDTMLGASLLHWWEIPDDEDPSYIDVDVASPPLYPGYAVQTLYDRVGGAHAVASGAGLGPWYFGSGGPNGGPMMMVGASQKLTATVNIAAANRCCLYVVGAMALVAGVRTLAKLFHATGSVDVISITRLSTHNWRYITTFTSGGQIKDVANLHNDWMLYSPTVPLSTGALLQTDGETTSPTWTGTSTLVAANRFYFGAQNTTGEGLIKAAWIVNDITPEKHAISVAYGRSLVC